MLIILYIITEYYSIITYSIIYLQCVVKSFFLMNLLLKIQLEFIYFII